MGNLVLDLKNIFMGLVGSGYVVYLSAGLYGELTPVLIDLPTSNESIDIILYEYISIETKWKPRGCYSGNSCKYYIQ